MTLRRTFLRKEMGYREGSVYFNGKGQRLDYSINRNLWISKVFYAIG